MSDWIYHPHLVRSPDPTMEFRKLSDDILGAPLSSFISTDQAFGKTWLHVQPKAYEVLTQTALRDIAFLFRKAHLTQVRAIFDDPEASSNDRFVAFELLKNANISSSFLLPSCQDTGTAIIIAKKGHLVFTDFDAEEAISKGVWKTYQTSALRYSQLSPKSMFEEINTKTNLPAQIELYSSLGQEVEFLFIAKGGGSANKTFLYQQTKSVLNPASLAKFLEDKIRTIGTSGCPPYHLAIVIGGLSAEYTLKIAKLASTKSLDHLPTEGNAFGGAYRDLEWEEKVLQIARQTGIALCG